MSLIHDALRRGPVAEGERGSRAAHADSVLKALGYRPGRRASARATLIVGLLLAFAVTGYIVLSFTHGADQAPSSVTAVPRADPARSPGGGAPGSASWPARLAGGSRVGPAPPAPSTPSSGSPETTTPEPRSTLPPATSPTPPLARTGGPVPEVPPARSAPRSEAIRRPSVTASGAVLPKPPGVGVSSARGTPVGPLGPPAAASSATEPDDFKLALYYQRAGDFEQALVHYQAVIGRDPLNVEAHNNLGRLYLDKGLFDDAIREFQRVTAIDPQYGRARTNLAATYFKQARYDLSAAEARAAIAIDPRNVDALVNLALAEKASGQVGDARESLLAALRVEPHNAAAHYNLARQCEDAGETALALTHYEAFLKYAGPDLMPYAPDVRSRIAALSAGIR